MGCSYCYCQGQKAQPALTEENIQNGEKNKETDEIKKLFFEATCDTVVKIWECECWKLYNTDVLVEEHLR